MKTTNDPFAGLKLSLGRDRNGNRTLKIKAEGFRTFSIQTLGNLPQTHRNGIGRTSWTPAEVADYVRKYGTKAQRLALGLSSF